MPVSSLKSSSPQLIRCYGGSAVDSTDGNAISLTELLAEAELEHYEQALRSQLKIMRVEHLKDVRESDLSEIGMSRPEQRRLMKAFNKYCPSSLARKLKQKVLYRKATTGQTGVVGSASTTWNMANGSNTPSSPYGLRRCSSNEETATASASAVLNDGSKKLYAADDSQTGDGEQHIIPASNIILCRQLGKGEFGTVWQGVWTTSSHSTHRYNSRTGPSLVKIQVAVKQIMPEKMLSSPLDFVREAAIMHRIHHENIVRFFGVVLDTHSIMLVTELAPSRSLAECLKEEHSAERISVIQLCEFAQQISSGMAYLETNRFIHRDLAARNILVFSSHKVKISDFGLSRALGTGEEYYRGNFTANLKLPIAWCAPECINYLKFTWASDVWAFGVTLWEMFTYGFQPWAGLNGQQIFDAVNAPKMCRLECPDACPIDYYNLMLKCWQHEPEQRPKFNEIHSILPTIEPERVVAVKPCQDGQLDHLQYALDAVITVLNKKPVEYPDGYYWKGVLKNGRTGLFLPTNTVAYLEAQRPGMPATSSVSAAFYKTKNHQNNHQNQQPNGHKVTSGFFRNAIDSIGGLARRSAGKPGVNGAFGKEKNGISKRIISLPQNDFRHMGHLGLDGNCFGDVPTDLSELEPVKTLPRNCGTQQSAAPSLAPKPPPRHPRLESSSETAYLLSPDYDYGGEDNTNPIFYRLANGDSGSGADLDDVQPVSIICGDNGGWLLEEVLQALDQQPSSGAGCTNVAARFSTEDTPRSPLSMGDEEDTDEEDMGNDRKKLWLNTASTKKQMDGYGKMNKENIVKPLSSSDTKMLDEIEKMADKFSTKALDKERGRLEEHRRKLGLDDEGNDKTGLNRKCSGEGSPSPTGSMTRNLMKKFHRSSPNSSPTAFNRKPTYTDALALKRDGNDLNVSPEAENAYKTLIEGKWPVSKSVLLPREERDDPQRPSVEEDGDDASTTEDDTNPLRMLRNEGANVVRRFTRQGSGRKQPLVEKPTPPVRRKYQEKVGNGGQAMTTDCAGLAKTMQHEVKAACSEQGEVKREVRSIRKPLPPPPPVPPRSSPRLDSVRKAPTVVDSSERPVIPPKPKFGNAINGRTEKAKVEVEEDREKLVDSTDDACPSFTLDDVNKYDLLNFVLSGLPETKIEQERQKLMSMEKGQRSSPRQHQQPAVASRKQYIIEDDVVHV